MKPKLLLLLFGLLAVWLVPVVFSSPYTGWQAAPSRTLVITPVGTKAYRLEWNRLPGEGGWLIQSAPSPYATEIEWRTVARSRQLSTVIPRTNTTDFFRVKSDPVYATTDEVPWLTIDPSMTLSSYNSNDRDSLAWRVVPNAEGGGNGLQFYGSCWKSLRLNVPRVINRDFAIGVSTWRDSTLSEWEAIGFQDTSGHSVWFTFGGLETRLGDSIYNSWSETSPLEYWYRWRLPVGELFASYYHRNGLLKAILFANKNEFNDPNGIWTLSHITDASGDQYTPSQISIRLNQTGNTSVQVAALLNGQPINRGVVKWDGDVDTRADGQTATLNFRTGGEKKILMRWIDIDRSERWTWATVRVNAPPPVKTSFSLCGVGDIMIARRFISDSLIARLGVDGLFDNIRPYLQQFDLTTANTECTYSISGTVHPSKTYCFRGIPAYLSAIPRNGIQVASLANNHTGDFGDDALREGIDNLNAIGAIYSGAGLNDGEAWRPAIVYRGGQRIAVFAYCTLTGREQNQPPYLEAAPHKGGFNWATRSNIDAQFAQVRPYVDFLMVQFHIGLAEYVTTPDGGARSYRPLNDPESDTYDSAVDTNGVNLADYMIMRGADMVICHGPHVPQGIVKRPGGKIIAYSTGNFLFDQYLQETFPSITVEADINQYSEIREARIRPIWLDGYRPGLARGRVAIRIMNHIGALSQAFGTALVEPSDGSLMRVVSDSAFFTKIVMQNDTLTVPMRNLGTMAETAPIQFGDSGIVDRIEMSMSGTGTLTYRIGDDILYGVGDMENEGAPSTYNLSSGGAQFDPVHYAGQQSLRLQRTSGFTTISIPSTSRYGIDRTYGNYTVYCRLLPGNVDSIASLRLDWWQSVTGNYPNGNMTVCQSVASTTWREDWIDLSRSNVPQYTNYLVFRFRLTGSGAATAYFDELAYINWDTGWTTGSNVTLPNPHRFTHIQVASSNPATTQCRVILHRSRLVQLARN